MKKAITVGLVFALALAALAGCGVNQEEESHRSGGEGYTGGPAWGKPAQKVVVNFEGIVSSVEDGTITLAPWSSSPTTPPSAATPIPGTPSARTSSPATSSRATRRTSQGRAR